MIDMRSSHSLVRGIVGLFVVLIGIAFLLDNLGIADSEDFIVYWPVVLIAVGIVKLIWGDDRPVGPIVLIVVGTWILLWNLDFIPYSFWELWPLLIVFFGLKILWHALNPPEPQGDVRASKTVSTDRSADSLNATALLGGNLVSSSSKNFRGGSAMALLGGAEVNLRNARIEGEPAVLDVFAFWGGVDVFVPTDWVVVNEVTPILGGSDDKTNQIPDGKQRLVIRGAVIMGGLEITN